MPEPIELYFWPTPNGWKISIALEEMGLPYTVNLVDLGAGDQLKPDYLRISPNNRMPAIVDPEGAEGEPVSVFESGAILLYLARKTHSFGGETERERIAVEEWLMWQMGGLGPMAGQAHHFLGYAPAMDPPQDLPYPKDRYRTEVSRLYSVLDRRLEGRDFVATSSFTIADMAIWPWASLWENQEQDLDRFPNMAAWLKRVGARPGVQAGRALHAELRGNLRGNRSAQKVLFKR